MKIEVLYPEVGNLYGELGNVRYLEASLEQSGIPYETIQTSLNERPRFLDAENGIDFVYMGTMTERSQEVVADVLRPLKEEIRAAAYRDVFLLATGNALEVFGTEVKDQDGEGGFQGIGLFPFHAVRTMDRHYNIFCTERYVKTREAKELVGFKCQFTQGFYDFDIDRDKDLWPLFQTQRGYGFHSGLQPEGLRYHNFMLTYVIGPIFVLNPYWMCEVMKEIGLEGFHPAYEKAAVEAYEVRLREFRDPKRNPIY